MVFRIVQNFNRGSQIAYLVLNIYFIGKTAQHATLIQQNMDPRHMVN
jgi:uncharacterized MAPEG superfamily protein